MMEIEDLPTIWSARPFWAIKCVRFPHIFSLISHFQTFFKNEHFIFWFSIYFLFIFNLDGLLWGASPPQPPSMFNYF